MGALITGIIVSIVSAVIIRRLYRRLRILQEEHDRLRKANDQLALELQLLRQDRTSIEEARHAAEINERMAALGTLAGGVAHEFNNLNAVILGHAELLMRRPDLSPDALRRLGQIREAVDRERNIVEALLAFSRNDRHGGEVVEAAKVVRTTIELARRSLKQRKVQVQLHLPPTPVHAAVTSGSLGQVLLNLLLNAADAVDGIAEAQVSVNLSSDGNELRLAVSDNGVGIRPEDLPHIFTPFFSTKGEHAREGSGQPNLRGTGLGLSVCRTLVGQMQGRIDVESRIGKGTTFTIILPVCEAGSSSGHHRALRLDRPLRLLLVDDEPELRRLLIDQLSADGHHVDEAGDGRQALERLNQEDYDIVILDWSMPVLDGAGFIDELALHPEKTWPTVVVLTGWRGEGSTLDLYRRDVAAVLHKPCAIEVMRETLARVLVKDRRIMNLAETSDEDSSVLPGP